MQGQPELQLRIPSTAGPPLSAHGRGGERDRSIDLKRQHQVL